MLKGHIVAASLHHFGMASVDDDLPPQVVSDLKQSQTQNLPNRFNHIMREILEKVVKLPNNPGNRVFVEGQPDGVFYYAQEVLTYGLLYAEFEDAIKEGDGPRVIRCWKFLLLIFKASDRRKYALEAATLLINIQILPKRIQQQIIWSHFVNTRGVAGHNQPCELHMEHLNRTAKAALGQHSNLNPKSVRRVGNCIGLLQNIKNQFDTVTGAHQPLGKHVRVSEETDLRKIIQQLLVSKVFTKTCNRCHSGFENINGSGLTDRIDAEKCGEWLTTHIHRLKVNYTYINTN